MLDGWYCRTLANQRAKDGQEDQNVNVDDESGSDESRNVPKAENDGTEQNNINNTNKDQVDFKAQYRYLKRKLKFLIYENEFFQDALRSNQRRLLKVSRDRAFLLDRLLQYEKPEDTTDSDATESSEDEATKEAKKRKTEPAANTSGATRGRKRKAPAGDGPAAKTVAIDKGPIEQQTIALQNQQQQQKLQVQNSTQLQGHMTAAEVERHLQSRQPILELMHHAPTTVPTEMFSNDPSLDGEPQEQIIDDSPSHVAAEECVPMEYAN